MLGASSSRGGLKLVLMPVPDLKGNLVKSFQPFSREGTRKITPWRASTPQPSGQWATGNGLLFSKLHKNTSRTAYQGHARGIKTQGALGV